VALLLAAPVFGQFGRTRDQQRPKAKVELLSSVSAVARNHAFDAGIRFELAEGWHIYWQNSGESGLPPSVTWDLPAGFSADDLRFPTPKRHRDASGITTNILDNDPVLLVRIHPPGTLSSATVTLKAKVRYLICAKSCIREEADVRLELPVVAGSADASMANEELFGRARRALPKKTSKYLSVSAETKPEVPKPGETFELQVHVDIKRGYHLQSHEPLSPSFIKTDVFLERADGVYFDKAVYPPPKFRTIRGFGKVSEYDGKVTVRFPGEVDSEAERNPGRFGGVVRYQACNNKGNCFPPDAVAFSLELEDRSGSQPVTAAGQEPSHQVVTAPIGPAGGPSADDRPTANEADATSSARSSGDASEEQSLEGLLARLGLPGLLLGCFLYGLLINATPCVLPLLSIKVLGFVQQAHESRRRTLVLGLAFGVGVILFFMLLGFLAAAGKNVLQYPVAVIALGAVVTALALSMLGVYTLQVPTAATTLEASIQKEGVLSSFGKGALAPVLGFACTGPLLAGAFGWATQQPPHIAVVAFLFAGLGMASPYMVLGANPNWLGFLPKPGNWMITFERIMGFLLLGMVIWLVHPLIVHIGPVGLEWTLGFFIAVSMGCWLLGKIDATMSAAQRWRYRGGAGVVVGGAAVLIYGWAYPIGEAKPMASSPVAQGSEFCPSYDSGIPWRAWSEAAVAEAVRKGHTVFVDFTAAYCTNCKVNKKVAINRKETLRKMEDLCVAAFQADFTTGDPEVFAALQKHGRAGVPMNLIYPANEPDQPTLMPVTFSLAELLAKLDEAGPSEAVSEVASASSSAGS
jgi:thiol:disulfide interchange protein DsbD